jgi:hypothetical protein
MKTVQPAASIGPLKNQGPRFRGGATDGASERTSTRVGVSPPRFVVALALWGLLLSAGPEVQGPPRDLRPVPEPDQPLIDVVDHPDFERWARTMALTAGEPLSFKQEPSLVLPRDDHGLRLRDFMVAGDVPQVRFDRWNPDNGQLEPETWQRERTETVAGRLVSVFQPAWSPDQVQRQLARARVGLDRPFFYAGSFRGVAETPAISHALFVRVGLSVARPVEIARIDDTVQYSSHVVNLMVPGFGDQRLATAVEEETVARKFYEHFEDSYEVLAIVPEPAHLDRYGAYHRTVQNQVEGIGRSRVSRHSAYGSAGTLLGVELNYNVRLLDIDVSNHELTHTWSHAFDWTRIAGITRAGHDPLSHAPLMTGGESLVSAVLEATRRPVIRPDGSAVIERVNAPARQHPLDLYAMGLLGPADVPEWVVFEDQGQFDATTTSTPAVGTAVAGGTRRVSINDIMAAHGPRNGPVLSSLSRATIVVTRDRLLSPEEMAYWNFFSARLEDPTGSGIMDYNGQPSFEVTTGRRIDVKTDIRPKVHSQIRQPHDVDPAAFGGTDCRGFEFTEPPRARVRAGERFRVAGRVTARDRTDFSQVLVRLWSSTGDDAQSVREFAEVSRAGEFRVDLEVRVGREGQYQVQLFLFWQNSGAQHPRCSLSPLIVSPPAGR